MTERYPKATWRGDATTYGPLPEHRAPLPSNAPLALVWHTTETEGMPSYNGGDWAPHLTFDPKTLIWVQHASLQRRVGSMRGFSVSGVRCNEKAIQVEIICYSQKSKVDDAPQRRIWVGALGDEAYAELAAFHRFCHDEFGVGFEVHAPPDGGAWRYGLTSSLRLTTDAWYAFGGATAHGGVPGNTHWDTGVLDIRRVADEAQGQGRGVDVVEPEPPVDIVPGGTGFYPLLAGEAAQRPDDVVWLNTMLELLGHRAPGDKKRWTEEHTERAMRREFPNGEPHRLTGSQAARLIDRLIERRVMSASLTIDRGA